MMARPGLAPLVVSVLLLAPHSVLGLRLRLAGEEDPKSRLAEVPPAPPEKELGEGGPASWASRASSSSPRRKSPTQVSNSLRQRYWAADAGVPLLKHERDALSPK